MTAVGARVAVAAVVVFALVAGGCPVFTALAPCAVDADCDDGYACEGDGFCRRLPLDAGRPFDRGDAGGPRHDAGGDGGEGADDDGGSDDDAGAPVDAGDDAGAPVDAGDDAGGSGDAGADDGGPGDAGDDGGGSGDDAGDSDAGLFDAGVDAGVVDAGAPPDAGFFDAGVDAGRALTIDVTAVSPLPLGTPVAAVVDFAAVGSVAGAGLALEHAGAPVPFVLDPDDPATIWFAAPVALASTATTRLILREGGGGPALLLDDVFPAGDAFADGALADSLTVELFAADGGVVAQETGGGFVVAMDDDGDSAVVRADVQLSRTRPFEARHRVRTTEVGHDGPTPGLYRLVSVLEGAPPAPTQAPQPFYNRELYTVVMAEDGLTVWYTRDYEVLVGWDGDSWNEGVLPPSSPFTTAELDVVVASDGTSITSRVERVDGGVLLVQPAPVPWSDVDAPTDGGPDAPLWIWWGEAFAAPGALYYWGDSRSEHVLVRETVVDEPVVDVSGP